MRLFFVLMTTLLGIYMILRGAIRLWKRGETGENVMEDPGLSEGVMVDFLMLVLGVFLVIPLFAILLN